jgi:hypothetical protein
MTVELRAYGRSKTIYADDTGPYPVSAAVNERYGHLYLSVTLPHAGGSRDVRVRVDGADLAKIVEEYLASTTQCNAAPMVGAVIRDATHLARVSEGRGVPAHPVAPDVA